MQIKTVTVVTNDSELLCWTKASLERAGYAVDGFKSGDEAVARLKEHPPRTVVADIASAAIQQSALPAFLRQHNDIVLVGWSHMPDIQASNSDSGLEIDENCADEPPYLRAYDYVPRSMDESGLVRSVERAIEHGDLVDEIKQLRSMLEFRAQDPSQPFSIPVLPDSGFSLRDVERDLLARALEKFRGNQTRTARYLNISRRTLIYRIGKYDLKKQAANHAATS